MTNRPVGSRIKRRIGQLLGSPATGSSASGVAPEVRAEVPGEDDAIVEALAQSFRRVPKKGTPEEVEWRRRTQEMLDAVSPDRVPHSVVRSVARNGLRIGRGLSFKSMLVQDSEIRKTLGMEVPSWLLDQKVSAYRFVDEMGLRRPKADLETYRFADLPLQPGSVVKPRQSTGSKGCYLIYSDSEILHVRDGERFSSYEVLAEHARGLMKADRRGRRVPDRWIFEELILEDATTRTPARDLKYFCFYGEVALILEVVRVDGVSKYSFRRPDQSIVTPGTWEYEYFEGAGTTEDELRMARQLSLQIPHAFCRIDLLKGEDGLVFGEFTPRPGGYHRFSAEWDRELGEAWARAHHRLQLDLLSGKRFEPFVRSTGMIER